MYGPYGTNYAAVFDPLVAGSHNFIIQAADNSAARAPSQSSGLFNVAVAKVLAQMMEQPAGSAKTAWLFT